MKKSVKSLKPYSIFQEIGANVPALKHFFRCLDTDGTMRDSIGGVSWTPSDNGFTLSRDATLNALYTDMTNFSPATAINGAFHNFTGAVMAIVAGRLNGASGFRFTIGDPSVTKSIGMASSNYHGVLGDNVTYARLANASNLPDNNGTDVVNILHYVPGSGVTLYTMYNLDTGAVIFAADTDTGTSLNVGSIIPDPSMRFSAFKVYGASYFDISSNTIPYDWKVGAFWQAANWKNNNRFIYPRWIGLS